MKEGELIEKFIAKDGREYTFRYVSKKDAKKLLSFINSLVEEKALILKDRNATLKDEREWVKDLVNGMKKKKAVGIVIEFRNKIVGHGTIKRKSFSRSHIGELGIAILKEFRGIGLGRELMKLLIENAKKIGCEMIILTVFHSNKIAKILYKKFGFKKFGILKKGLKKYGKYYDEIFMVKYLKK
ncbi:MAG: hypothetical protein B6U78_02950 [Candidatus Aenigmarchaeota archaeon ex4484_224]|nr:MAG: hypothetical protein B6U78_02950 [Candidatus Aenigmarchaeota archaeon ex4484_224]